MNYKTNIKLVPAHDKSGCTMTAIGEDGAIIGGPDFYEAPVGVPFEAWLEELSKTVSEACDEIIDKRETEVKI